MADYYECFSCMKVMPLIADADKKCVACGGTNGQVISHERFEERFKAGAIFNIDPSTGQRAKKRR
jgi:hypothetical protein